MHFEVITFNANLWTSSTAFLSFINEDTPCAVQPRTDTTNTASKNSWKLTHTEPPIGKA